MLGGLIVLIYLYYVAKFSYHKVNYFDRTILAMANSIVIVSFFKTGLKFVFGRYWPKTWVNNNISLISNHAYGFHFFHSGKAYQSFPSGHAAVVTAAMLTIWFAYPRLRWLCVSIIALVVIGLIGLDYHFISDVIAGGFLGAIVAYYVTKISQIEPKTRSNS